MPWLHCLVFLTLGLSGCETIANWRTCAALPRVVDGGGCAHTETSVAYPISTTELLDLLDTQTAPRNCVPKYDLPVCADDQTSGVPVTLPARGPAVIMPADDWNAMATALATMCRQLGSGCSYQTLVTQLRMKNLSKSGLPRNDAVIH